MKLKLMFILAVLFLGPNLYAGRPVYHDLTLSDLVTQSEGVLIVKNLKITTKDLPCGWSSENYSVEIVNVLASKQTKFSSGQKISFDPSPTRTTDCELRKDRSSGASFSASRYKSTLDLSKLQSLSKFVVFIKGSGNQLQLVSDLAIEDVEVVKKHLNSKENKK